MNSKPSKPPDTKLTRFKIFDLILQMPLRALGTAAIWIGHIFWLIFPRCCGMKSCKCGASRANVALFLKKRIVCIRKTSLFKRALWLNASSLYQLNQWFSKWAESSPWGRFWGARARKTRGVKTLNHESSIVSHIIFAWNGIFGYDLNALIATKSHVDS